MYVSNQSSETSWSSEIIISLGSKAAEWWPKSYMSSHFSIASNSFTCDERWVHYYTPESKCAGMEWKGKGEIQNSIGYGEIVVNF